MGATGSLWYFKQATSAGTTDYNTAGSNVPASQNSFGVHLRPYFSTTATNTFSNIRFYQSTTWTSTTYGAVGTSNSGYTQSTGSSTAATDGGGSNSGVPTGSATNAAIALGTLTLGNASGYGPTFLRVQLTTNSSAPAGDTPFGGQKALYAKRIDQFVKFGGYLLTETIPSQVLILIRKGVETKRRITNKVKDIVRAIWQHIELVRNYQSTQYSV